MEAPETYRPKKAGTPIEHPPHRVECRNKSDADRAADTFAFVELERVGQIGLCWGAARPPNMRKDLPKAPLRLCAAHQRKHFARLTRLGVHHGSPQAQPSKVGTWQKPPPWVQKRKQWFHWQPPRWRELPSFGPQDVRSKTLNIKPGGLPIGKFRLLSAVRQRLESLPEIGIGL